MSQSAHCSTNSKTTPPLGEAAVWVVWDGAMVQFTATFPSSEFKTASKTQQENLSNGLSDWQGGKKKVEDSIRNEWSVVLNYVNV